MYGICIAFALGALSAQPMKAVAPRLSEVIQIDEAMQREIADVVDLLVSDESRESGILKAEALCKSAGSQQEHFVQQAMLFDDDPENGERGLMALLLVERCEISATKKALAVLPWLADTRTRDHQEVLRLLSGTEGRQLDAPDFSHYRSLLQGEKERFPDALADYMFRRSPGEALTTFARTLLRDQNAVRPILWAEHVVEDYDWRSKNAFLDRGTTEADVTAELETLAAHEQWWARRYVVEILRRYPEFDDGPMMEKLRADSYVLVKDRANEPASAR